MSNYLTIRKIYAIEPPLETISMMLEDDYLGIEWGGVYNNNWPKDYPYAPKVEFWAAHNEQTLFLKFRVNEEAAKAEVGHDGGEVWNDSCVEFFISFDGTGYYNFEFSCIGKMLLGFRKDRTSAWAATPEVYDMIKRYSTLGTECFAEKKIEGEWELTVAIPKEAFFAHNFETLEGLFAMGNAYKCGDGLSKPHYLSWNPIINDTPNFHLQQYFGRLKFI